MNPPDPYALTGNPSTIAAGILGPLSIEQRVQAVAMAIIAVGGEAELRLAVERVREIKG